MEGATVSVAVVTSRTEAELIVGLLRSHGLRAAVAADDAGGQYPQLQMEGVRVLVPPSDEASARRFLAAADDTPEDDPEVRALRHPGEQYQAPRSWAERAYPNLMYFNEVDRGGHFAAWEQPQLFTEEIRAAFRSLR